MRAKPMADIWSRSSGYVRLRLRAGRFRAAGQCAEECEGQEMVLLPASPLHFWERGANPSSYVLEHLFLHPNHWFSLVDPSHYNRVHTARRT
jgi:hypothetical protein